MPRDASGNYTLPAGNPVVSGTIIDVNWANPTMSDIAVQLNNVLTRDGLLGPITPIKFDDGTELLPGISWNTEASTGFYRVGAGVMGVSILGNEVARWDATDFTLAPGINFVTSGASAVVSDAAEPLTFTDASATIAWRSPIAENPPAVSVGRSADQLVLTGENGISLENSTNAVQFFGTVFAPNPAGTIDLGSSSNPWARGYFTESVAVDAPNSLVMLSANSSVVGWYTGAAVLEGYVQHTSAGRMLLNGLIETDIKVAGTTILQVLPAGLTVTGNVVTNGGLYTGSTATAKFLGSFASGSAFNTNITVPTPSGLTAALILIGGSETGTGNSWSRLFLLALKASGGAAPDVGSTQIGTAGDVSPTPVFATSGGFLTINVGGNGTATAYAHVFGIF